MLKSMLVAMLLYILCCLPVLANDCKVLVDDGNLNSALTCYMQEKQGPATYINIGTIYTLEEKYEEALKYFQLAYILDPENPAARYSYGVGLINVSKQNPVISYAIKNENKDSNFEFISVVNKMNIYARYNSQEVHGEIVNTNY